MFYLYRLANKTSLNQNIDWDKVFNDRISIDNENFSQIVNLKCFTLSDNDKLNGNYLSLNHADGVNSIDRIRKCFSWHRVIRKSFPLYFGFCEIDRDEALDSINDEEKIISFEQKGHPTKQKTTHYGLFFDTKDPKEILEAKNALVLLSKFFPCAKDNYNYLGEFSKSNSIDNLYILD